MLNESDNFYDILDLRPDASPHQIREAYLRAKATYHKDSAALYSIISTEEREDILHLIEEAYKVLSSPQKRKEYDQKHGILDPSGIHDLPMSSVSKDFFSQPTYPTIPSRSSHQKVVSIDRTSPFGNEPISEEMLISPTTHTSHQDSSLLTNSQEKMQIQPNKIESQNRENSSLETLKKEIEVENDWSGAFLRKVREATSISIEEVSNITKINKHYLFALEEENFSKLPASAYVRGFVSQIAKLYRLPIEKVIQGYMSRLTTSREPKKK